MVSKSGGRAIPAEGRAGSRALGQEGVWIVPKHQGGQCGYSGEEIRGGTWGRAHVQGIAGRITGGSLGWGLTGSD